jgi:HSP20 family protein
MSKELGELLEVARIQSEINRLFDNLLDLDGDAGSAWIPNADILETRDALVLKVELPGVDPENLSVSVQSGHVTIVGQKGQPRANDGHFHTTERQFGAFRRTIQIGAPVNSRMAEAVLDNGLLRISFPKVPNRRGEEVPVEVKTS